MDASAKDMLCSAHQMAVLKCVGLIGFQYVLQFFRQNLAGRLEILYKPVARIWAHVNGLIYKHPFLNTIVRC